MSISQKPSKRSHKINGRYEGYDELRGIREFLDQAESSGDGSKNTVVRCPECEKKNGDSSLCESESTSTNSSSDLTVINSAKLCEFADRAFKMISEYRLSAMVVGKNEVFTAFVNIWAKIVKSIANPRCYDQHFCGKLVQVFPAIMLQRSNNKKHTEALKIGLLCGRAVILMV